MIFLSPRWRTMAEFSDCTAHGDPHLRRVSPTTDQSRAHKCDRTGRLTLIAVNSQTPILLAESFEPGDPIDDDQSGCVHDRVSIAR
jgi:hypothetical protein